MANGSSGWLFRLRKPRQPNSLSKLKIYVLGSWALEMNELIRKVWRFITKMSKQMGRSLTFLAESKKYNAPKMALPMSMSAAVMDGSLPSALSAFGSNIMKQQPAKASATPIHSLLEGVVPVIARITTMNRPCILLKT
jgi:hypothetical protein